MKKITTFLFAIAIISAIMSQITMAGYGAGYSSPGGGGGASGANTTLSNLTSTAINTDITPGTDNAFNLGSTSFRWASLILKENIFFYPASDESGIIQLAAPITGVTSYSIHLPPAQGSAGQTLSNNGAGILSWSTTMATYDSGGSIKTASHIVQDTCTLGTNCSITLTGSAVFTSSSSYTCLTQDETAIAATKCVQTSGSALVITGTGTDVIKFALIGN